MFNIVQSADYSWPVTVNLPGENGRSEKHTFDARFKRISQSRLMAVKAAVQDSSMGDAEFVREVLVGWNGVSDSSGSVPFSEDARERLLEIAGVAGAIVTAFMDSLTGAPRKN